MASKKGNSGTVPGSLLEILEVEEFRPLLQTEMGGLFELYDVLERLPRNEWAKRHFNRMHQEADQLETFLDDYGALNNRMFHRLRGLVAGVRSFADSCHVLKHMDLRLPQYDLHLAEADLVEFETALHQASEFSVESLVRLLKELDKEAATVGCPRPKTRRGRDTIALDEVVRRRLPYNVDEEDDVAGESQRIVEFTTAFLEAVKAFDQLSAGPFTSPAAVVRFVEQHFREEDVRNREAMIHNLQSKYDTYVRNTQEERNVPNLPVLRGHVSVVLHLMEFAIRLVHFYERHESSVRLSNVRIAIESVVDKSTVLDRAVHFALAWAKRLMLHAKPLAAGILADYTQEQTIELEIPDGAVLHARPASLVVSIVNHHGTPVEIELDGETANAGSIMQVMILAGTKAGSKKVRFRGDVNPLRDLSLLFAARLGEDGTDTLPDELGYLT